jgi:hypothetical protein
LTEKFYSWLTEVTATTLRKAMKKAGVEPTRLPKNQIKVGRARVN